MPDFKKLVFSEPWKWVALAIFVMAIVQLSHNADMPYLWFDEAGQFWIAKGLNHDSNPLSTPGGFIEVLQNNRHYNRDPGGFSVVLHYWALVANDHVWLRMLPFTMFTVAVAMFVTLVHGWTGNLVASLAIGMLPLFSYIEKLAGFELRGYSMEMMGTLFCILALQWLRTRLTVQRLTLVSCAMAFFITSRYSEILVVFAASLYVAWLILLHDAPWKQRLVCLVAYSGPLLAMLIAVYTEEMHFQNADAKPLYYLPYLSNEPQLLLEPKHLAFLAFLAMLGGLFLLQRRIPAIRKYQPLLALTLGTNVVFILLSLMGKHPWGPFTQRCISLHLLSIACVAAFLAEFYVFMARASLLRHALLAGSFAAAILGWTHLSFYNADLPSVYTYLKQDQIPADTRFYVDRWESPSVRYLFEYGALHEQAKYAYPANFTFGKYRRHSDWSANGDGDSIAEFYRDKPRMNSFTGIDIMIAPELYKFGDNDQWKPLPATQGFYVRAAAPVAAPQAQPAAR